MRAMIRLIAAGLLTAALAISAAAADAPVAPKEKIKKAGAKKGAAAATAATTGTTAAVPYTTATTSGGWFVHDARRPIPPIVDPGEPGKAPADAIVLFDGASLDEWCNDKDGGPTAWIIQDGVMQPTKKSGYIRTKREFGDCQLHVEFATPAEVSGSSQGRGNSGVFLMGRYEIQVLDSFDNVTYADGQAAAVYGQSPPLVNASRGPGQWQTYDIVFRRPVFEGDKVVKPATVTVFHNGVLVQDNWEIMGTTNHKKTPAYQPHPDRMPLKIQDHNNPVKFRNIWIRELPERPKP